MITGARSCPSRALALRRAASGAVSAAISCSAAISSSLPLPGLARPWAGRACGELVVLAIGRGIRSVWFAAGNRAGWSARRVHAVR